MIENILSDERIHRIEISLNPSAAQICDLILERTEYRKLINRLVWNFELMTDIRNIAAHPDEYSVSHVEDAKVILKIDESLREFYKKES